MSFPVGPGAVGWLVGSEAGDLFSPGLVVIAGPMTKVEIENMTAKRASSTAGVRQVPLRRWTRRRRGDRRKKADGAEQQRAADPSEQRPGEEADVMQDMGQHAEHDGAGTRNADPDPLPDGPAHRGRRRGR